MGLDIQLKKKMSIDCAIEIIFSKLIGAVLINRSLILSNSYDTEYLHHMRVALRKARTLLTCYLTTLTDGGKGGLTESLSVLARRTNSLRDLDVLLLSKNHYLTMVGKGNINAVNNLFQILEKKRNMGLCKVHQLLRSDEYLSSIELCEHFINSRKDKSKNFEINNLIYFSMESNMKAFKAVECLITAGKKSDKYYHKLRIRCKRLRYLIECFSSLYDRVVVEKFRSKLVALQDSLGRINDLTVQQVILQDMDSELLGKDEVIENLILLLIEESDVLKESLSRLLLEFITDDNFNENISLFKLD